jgi:putative endonuclease
MAGLVPAISILWTQSIGNRDARDKPAHDAVSLSGPELTLPVMAGLVPAIPIRETRRVRQFYVYILASRPGGALYVGVTNNLVRRVYEHKHKVAGGHTKRYGIDRLGYYEVYETAYQAIQREKKHQTLADSLQDTAYRERERYLARSL